MPTYQHRRVTEDEHIATLTLNRSDVNNSLVLQTLAELRTITADFSARYLGCPGSCASGS